MLITVENIQHRPVDGGSKHLWNVGKILPDCTAQQPTRQQSSHSTFLLKLDVLEVFAPLQQQNILIGHKYLVITIRAVVPKVLPSKLCLQRSL
jgi:hypothetical protein